MVEISSWNARVTRCLVSLALALAGSAVAGAAVATAAGQFTLDPHADSFGAIVTDSAGNGYVAWERANPGGADIPMFCRLAAGATSCPHPIALALPGGTQTSASTALTLFPILGPGSVVWVVTSRYIQDDTVIWTSIDGGDSFGAPHDIPSGNQCLPNGMCETGVPYTGLTGVDDTLPIDGPGATYNRQSYIDGVNQPFVDFLQSSSNPGLGFSWDETDVVDQFEPGISEYTFAAPGSGGVGGSALGTTFSGDVVEAYWLDSSPATLGYYFYTPSAAHPGILIATQAGWAGPVTLGDGYVPRLADGAAGLFMVSVDGPHGGQPTAVDIRKWSTVTHGFGAPQTIASAPASSGDLFEGGGLAENYDTGEIAAVWPSFSATGPDQMRLFLSSNGGAQFSGAQDIASIGYEYAGPDNARVAIADNGTGFVTFRDSRGLQVANLSPLAVGFKNVRVHGQALSLPVTCSAPKGDCLVKLTLAVPHLRKPLHWSYRLGAGVTRSLKLRFSQVLTRHLKALHGRVGAKLTLVIRAPGAPPDQLKLHVAL